MLLGILKMKQILAIAMFGLVSLMSAQSSAVVTEGDVLAGANFAKSCETGVFNYLVHEGHLARMYIGNRPTAKSKVRVSVNGDILKIIDKAKMVDIKFKSADGTEIIGFTTFFFGYTPGSDRDYDPGNWHGCE
jgi:hypothetical protein